MKNVLFIVCFSLGVTLMIFSGYLPQPASAKAAGNGNGNAVPAVLYGQEFAGTVTRKVPPGEPVPADLTPPAQSPVLPPPAADNVTTAEPIEAPLTPSESGAAAAEAVAPSAVAGETALFPAGAQVSGTALAPVEAAPVVIPESRVVADAGAERVIWAGWDEITLDGSASVGDRLTYLWRQTGGPSWLNIQADDRPVTTATGLIGEEPPGWRTRTYQFELAVMDADGRDAAATVKYVVKTAPNLKIKPTAERRFELRDGYWLAHFTSWATNLESYEQVFDLTSDRELRFTKVSGGTYEITGGRAENGYLYQVVVYGQTGEPTSWVEFLVDTDEKIPGVVQLGVNWETR